jgi:hypothetical protein
LPDDATSGNDGPPKRRGRRKKVEQVVEEKPEEKDVDNENSSDTDIAVRQDSHDCVDAKIRLLLEAVFYLLIYLLTNTCSR